MYDITTAIFPFSSCFRGWYIPVGFTIDGVGGFPCSTCNNTAKIILHEKQVISLPKCGCISKAVHEEELPFMEAGLSLMEAGLTYMKVGFAIHGGGAFTISRGGLYHSRKR